MKAKKQKKFTFKTTKPTGRYSSFFSIHHYIKIRKKECGKIDDKSPYRIRLMVIKKDINEDGNPNCKWKWIAIKKESKTLQEAKDFLNNNIDKIVANYELHFSD